MSKNLTKLGQDSSGWHGPTVVADVVGSDNGNRRSAFPTNAGDRTGRRKMRVVGKYRQLCISPSPIKEEIKSDVESAPVEVVSTPASAPAPAALPPSTTTWLEVKVVPDKENSQSAVPCRDSADTVVSPPLSTEESADRSLPEQSGSPSDTLIGGGQSVADRHRSSRQLITNTAVPFTVECFEDCDSTNSGRSSSSSSCRSSSSMSLSSDSNAESKNTVSLVPMVVGGSSSSDDQVTIKHEANCRGWNDSKDDNLIVIDYTRTSRYPEKKVFNYQEYEHSLLLQATEKMVNGGQLRQQSTFKAEEATELNTEQQQEQQQLLLEASSSGSSDPFPTSNFYIPKTKDDEDRKLFIGGLSFDTSECDLEKYFSRFGVVDGVNLKYDPETGISRCFAFISFAEEEAAEEVLRQPMHIVNGRWVEPRRAKSRPVYKKLFVGGIDSSFSTDDIRDYFSRFGKVAQVDIPFDRMSQQRRHFCFVIFQTEEAAEEAAMWPRQMLRNRLLDVRRTVPNNVLAQQKRMAQAAGLDLNKYDCNYKLGKMNATARMVTASAAMAAAALATPITPNFMPNHFSVTAAPFSSQSSAAVSSYPQMSVTPTGALIPFADHISQASMAALGVANEPQCYPAAVAFSSNLYSASNVPVASTYYPTPTPHSYAYPYMNTASTYVPAALYHSQNMQVVTPQYPGQQSYSSSAAYGYPAGANDYTGYYSQYYSNYISQQTQPPPPPPPPPPVEPANQTITSSSFSPQLSESNTVVTNSLPTAAPLINSDN